MGGQQVAESPNNHGKPWTEEHLALLLQLHRMGVVLEIMAIRLGRSERATKNQLASLKRCAAVVEGCEPSSKKKKRPESWLSLSEVLECFEVTEKELLEACLAGFLRVLPSENLGVDSKKFSLVELRALFDEKGPMELANKKSKLAWVKKAKKVVTEGSKYVGGAAALKIAEKIEGAAFSEVWAHLVDIAESFTRSAERQSRRPRSQVGWLQTGEPLSGYLSGESRPRTMARPLEHYPRPESSRPHLSDRVMRPGRDYQTR